MFEEIRRKDRVWHSSTESAQLLLNGEYGFLALGDDKDACGYGVPISYAYEGDEILFHCAPEGKKLDIIKDGKKASFCVVGKTEIIPEKFTTKYESVMVFGTVSVCKDEVQRTRGIEAIVRKYSPEFIEKSRQYMKGSMHRTTICSLKISAITAKCKR